MRSHLLDARSISPHINDIPPISSHGSGWITSCWSVIPMAASWCRASLAGSKIASIVYADAFVPENGENLIDQVPRIRQSSIRFRPRASTMPRPVVLLQSDAQSGQRLDRCDVHAAAGPAFIENRPHRCRDRIARKKHISGEGFLRLHLTRSLKSPSRQMEYIMPCGHDLMIEMPDQTTEILLQSRCLKQINGFIVRLGHGQR